MTGSERLMIWTVCLVTPLLWAGPKANSQLAREGWLRADDAIVRLNPSVFPNLPTKVRIALEQRGCTIPQPYDTEDHLNVVSGTFVSPGRISWAVLCSRERQSTILVFYGNGFGRVDAIAQEADIQYLQTVSGNGNIGYSRRLGVATPKEIRRYFERDAQNQQRVDHDGLDDAFIGKSSVVWYRSSNQWIRLSATD